jgi:hypothetical protein
VRERTTVAASHPLATTLTVVPLLFRQTRRESVVLRRDTVLRTPAAPPSPAAPPTVAVPARPLTMVLRRSTPVTPAAGQIAVPAAPAPASTEASARGSAGVTAGWPPAATAPRAIPLSSRELRELTDHVVTALDQRLIAHRERMGNR